MSSKKVVVVGGGAGGMPAAGRAAEKGASVTLLEKMERTGKKMLISGNTRCNLSNTLSLDGFISMYGSNGKFLYPAFSSFFPRGIADTIRQVRYQYPCGARRPRFPRFRQGRRRGACPSTIYGR